MKRILSTLFAVVLCAVAFQVDAGTCFLQQSTGSQNLTLPTFVDSTDGASAETGLTIANTDIKLSKGFAATTQTNKNSGGATHIATGDYYITLDAIDTNTVGPLKIKVAVAGALPVWVDCMVLPTANYAALFSTAPGASGGLLISGTNAGTTTLGAFTVTGATTFTGAVTGSNASNNFRVNGAAPGASGGLLISGTNAGTTTLGALTVTGATTFTGATTWTGALTASNASNNFRVNGVAPGASGGLFIAGTNAATTITTGLTTNLTGNVSGSVGSVTGNVGGIAGTIQTLDALDTAQDTQHSTTQGLIGTPTDFGSGTSTLAGNLQDLADNGTATFDRSTDSLQAVRDRGDSAWTSAGANSYDLGIIDAGTAQAATGTTLQLRSAAAFSNDDDIVGATILITGGSAGVGQSRTITAYDTSTDTATVETWTTTPTGTITYNVFGTAASSGGGSGLDAAGVRAAVGLASANLDTQLGALPTAAEVVNEWETQSQADPTGFHVNVLEVGGTAQTANDNGADINAILVDTGTTLQGELDGIQADTENLQSRIPAALVGGRIDATVDGTGMEAGAVTAIQSGLATAAALATVDTVADAIQVKTDQLTFGVTGKVDSNLTHVNETEIGGDGGSGTEFGPVP